MSFLRRLLGTATDESRAYRGRGDGFASDPDGVYWQVTSSLDGRWAILTRDVDDADRQIGYRTSGPADTGWSRAQTHGARAGSSVRMTPRLLTTGPLSSPTGYSPTISPPGCAFSTPPGRPSLTSRSARWSRVPAFPMMGTSPLCTSLAIRLDPSSTSSLSSGMPVQGQRCGRKSWSQDERTHL